MRWPRDFIPQKPLAAFRILARRFFLLGPRFTLGMFSSFKCFRAAGSGVVRNPGALRWNYRYGTIFLTVFLFAFETSVSPARAAFRPGRFLVRMCEWKAWLRCSFPVPLFLNRLAAPRWVFSFGIARVLTSCDLNEFPTYSGRSRCSSGSP